MHPGLVRATRRNIAQQMDKLKEELNVLQNTNCSHVSATKEHKGNTGNWCPQDDCYWTEFSCPDCGKWWTEEGSK